MATPKRIQRSRKRGSRMPAGAVYVGRPSRWGNPFTQARDWPRGIYDFSGCHGNGPGAVDFYYRTRQAGGFPPRLLLEWFIVELFREFILQWRQAKPEAFEKWIAPLRGKDLACWCRLDRPCHADVLLELANE